MNDQIQLDHQERALLLDLLERERRDLTVEVRRTSTPDVHDQLVHRQQRVDDLIERFSSTLAHEFEGNRG